MEKLKMHSPNQTDANIARIRELFPNCVTEAKDEQGVVRHVVDFDQLRQELNDHIVDGPQERFRLDWPGKREALFASNAPIAKTLRPNRDASINFDGTRNLFIEGDNLEALKLLQEAYLGKVKLIYIDPPYNTGNDFIYNDDFSESSRSFLERSNQVTTAGDRLVANTEANGRFHSDWLSMMYSRLKIAKKLLAANGVIFISIDSHEVHHLRSVCDEVFGEASHKNTIAVRRGIKNVQAQFDDLSALSQGHEYVLVYAKNKDVRLPKLVLSHGEQKPGKWDTFWRGTDRPTMRYELFGVLPDSGQWRWEQTRTEEAVRNYEEYLARHAQNMSLDEWYLDTLTATNVKLNFVRKNEEGTVQYYVPPSEGKLLSDNWMDITLSGNETDEFDTEKSVALLQRIVSWVTKKSEDALVLDFFAGSATTAHAVIAQNAQDGGNRRFILVQLPVAIAGGSGADQRLITDISRGRIVDSGKQIVAQETNSDWNKDVGFRVLGVDTSNMADVYYKPEATAQDDLLGRVDNIKAGRNNPEDLLFQVLVDWGVDLSLPMRKETVRGKSVYFVNAEPYDLIACFDSGVSEDLVKELAKYKPVRMVFRDNGFESDAVKINVEQIFRQLSPSTDVKAI